MTPTFASIALTLALLTGDGLRSSEPVASAPSVSVGIVPTVDVAAPLDWGVPGEDIRRGGQVSRIEFDDINLNSAISPWYRLAFLDGGTRLQVFEHSSIGIYGSDSVIARSERTAWTVANEAVGPSGGAGVLSELPSGARVRTSNTNGPSAGLIFTLAYIDLLTSGDLVGDLRVAGTGGISANGYVFAVSGVEVKVATALLADPDVVFSPRPSRLIEHTTVIESEKSRDDAVGDTVGEWLNVEGYEQAGREAAGNPDTTAFVVVHDYRQALAWLCGRSASASACAIAHRTAAVPIAISRP